MNGLYQPLLLLGGLMLQFDFLSPKSIPFWDLAIFCTSVFFSSMTLVKAHQMPEQKPVVAVEISFQKSWIDSAFFLHFHQIIKRIHLPQLWIKKLVIAPNSIIFSGLANQQQAFYDFWQVLKQDSKVANVDLLNWYKQGQSFYFDVRASLT